MWHKKLRKLPRDQNQLENLKIVEDGYSDGECLFMSKTSKLDAKLSLNVGSCKEKHPTICRVEQQKINILAENSKFPCLVESRVGRRKRSTEDKNQQAGDGIKGKLLIMHNDMVDY